MKSLFSQKLAGAGTFGTALAAGALPVAVLLLHSCGGSAPVQAKKGQSGSDKKPAVAIAKVKTEDLNHEVTLTAEFRPFQEVDVMAKVAGYVKHINVDVGDRVRQGQVLAEIEVPEMIDDRHRAEAAIKRYQAEVERSKEELKRANTSEEIARISYERLADVVKKQPGLVAQQEIDDARARAMTASAHVAEIRSQLAAVQEQVQGAIAEKAKLDTMYSYTKVVAPFDGVVTKRYLDNGAMIQAGTASQAHPLVRLSQNGLLRLTLPVPESLAARISRGSPVQVRVPSVDRTFHGEVARTSEKLDLATRTMPAEVDVRNANYQLIPGMYAEVSLGVEKKVAALTVPVSAVDNPETDPVAYVVSPAHTIDIRHLQVGMQTADSIEVLSGLQEGDMVVIANRSRLAAGEAVAPKIVELAEAGAAQEK